MGNTVHSKVEQRLEHFKAVAKKAGVKLTHQRGGADRGWRRTAFLGSIANAHVEVRGVCAKCLAQRADEPSGAASTSQPQGRARHD